MPFGSIKEQVHSGSYSRGNVPRPAPRTPPPLSRGGPPLAPKPAPSKQFTRSVPSSQPFEAAQRHAQQRVQATRPSRVPAPYIPRLPNPTREQVQAALGIALRAQARAVGPNPGVGRIREYHQELLSDPRNREYVQTLMHYQRAGEAHERQSRPASQDESLSPVLKLADSYRARGLSASAAFSQALSTYARVQSETSPQANAARAQAVHESEPRLGVPGVGGLLGTIPARPVIGVIQSAANLKLGLGGVPGKLLNEVVDLPGQAVLSGAQTGSALAEGAKGNWAPARTLGTAIAHQVEHPIQTFKQAPLSTALMAAGAESAVGGALGKVLRSGALGETAAGLASRARPDLKLYNAVPDQPKEMPVQVRMSPREPVRAPAVSPRTPAREGIAVTGRRYNPNPLRKAAQVAYEKGLTKLPGDLRQRDPFQAEGWRLNRHLVGGKVKAGHVDYTTAGGEQARRIVVKSTVGKVVETHPKVGAEAVPLIFDGTVRRPATLVADLQKRAAALRAVQPELKPAELTANRTSLRRVEKLLANKVFLRDPSEAFAAAERLRAIQKPLTVLRVTHGGLEHEQLRASLFPYAQAHMDAKYFTVADHQAAGAKAVASEQNVARRVAESPARVASAEAALERATQLERVRNTIDLANRPGTAAEGAAAAAMVEKLKRRYGVKDLREGGTVAQAEHRLRETREAQSEAVEALPRARRFRASVSGRGPVDQVLAHEDLIRAHSEARSAVPKAQEALRRAEAVRSRLVGAQRAGGASAGQDARAASGGGDAMAAAEAKVAGAREALRAANVRHAEARNAAASSKPPAIKPGLRRANGEYLPTQEILDHMKANGVDVGFISHKPNTGGRWSYYQSVRRLPSLERLRRTGESYRKGIANHSYEALAGQIASDASRVAQHEVRAHDLNQYVLGSYDTPKAAQDAADNFHVSGHPMAEPLRGKLGKMVVVDKGSHQVLDRGFVHTTPDVKGTLEQFGLREHMPAVSVEHGKYGIVPEGVVKRMDAHDNAVSAKSDLKRLAQAYTQAFRHVKFATSPKHMLGVTQEQAIRVVTEQAGPLAWYTGRKFNQAISHLAQTDEHGVLADNVGPLGADYRQMQGVLAGRGGLVASSRENEIMRNGEQWQESSMARAAGKLGGSPPVKAWVAYRKATEAGLIAIEHGTRQALAGKALRETGFINNYRQVLKMQDAGMRALAEGKLTPNMAVAIARKVDDMGGNWNHQTPIVRAAVSAATPFANWWLNSMRWLYRLPVTHPIKTAIAASLYNATREVRNAEGQGYDAQRPEKGYLQGTFRATLPVFGDVRVDLGHYSPLGTMGPEVLKTAADQAVPQFKGILDAAQGVSPLSGEKLKDAHGKELGWQAALVNALAEAVSGPSAGATQAQQLLQHGGKPYGTANLFTDVASKLGGGAQVKPGSETGLDLVITKLLDPVRLYKAKGGGSSSAPVSNSPRDLVRQGMREEAIKSHERDAVREAIREGLRNEAVHGESAYEQFPAAHPSPLRVDPGEARARAFGPVPGLKSGDPLFERPRAQRLQPFEAALWTSLHRLTAPYTSGAAHARPIPSAGEYFRRETLKKGAGILRRRRHEIRA